MDRRSFLKLLAAISVGTGLLHTPERIEAEYAICLGEFSVAGFQYHEGMHPLVADQIKNENPLLILREPDNPFDPCALKVTTQAGQMLGYIPRQHNRVMATLADQGIPLRARLSSFIEDAEPWERLQITVLAQLLQSPV